MRHGVSAEALAGTWRLVEFRVELADGRPPRHPYGLDAEGTVIYGLDGWMSAVLCRAGRRSLGARRLEAYQSAHDADKVEAFDSYLSYVGRWSLEREAYGSPVVVHTVEQALVPELVGQQLRRHVDLDADGQGLVLSYEVRPRQGSPRTYRLSWRRP